MADRDHPNDPITIVKLVQYPILSDANAAGVLVTSERDHTGGAQPLRLCRESAGPIATAAASHSAGSRGSPAGAAARARDGSRLPGAARCRTGAERPAAGAAQNFRIGVNDVSTNDHGALSRRRPTSNLAGNTPGTRRLRHHDSALLLRGRSAPSAACVCEAIQSSKKSESTLLSAYVRSTATPTSKSIMKSPSCSRSIRTTLGSIFCT